MDRFIFNLICSFVFVSNAQAASISPYSSYTDKRAAFSALDNQYEDTRIDANLDGKIDIWNIRQANLEISVRSVSDRDIFHIRKFINGQVIERIVVKKSEKIFLAYSKNRKVHFYYQSNYNPICISTQESEWEKLKKSFAAIQAEDLDSCTTNYLDNSCKVPGLYEPLQKVVQELYMPPTPEEPNTFLSCVESDESKKLFEKRFGSKVGLENYLQTVVNYKNKIINYLNASKQKTDATISCKETNDPNDKPKSTETGQIRIIVNKDKPKIGRSLDLDLQSQTFHESIHTTRVEDEVLTNALTRLCVNKEKDVSITYVPGAKGVAPINVEKAAETASLKASDAIPASIAEAPKPLPPSGSPQEMNRVADALGAEQTMKISRSQTSGVIRMAENVLSATPAVAASATTTLASNSKTSSGSRLPASEPSPTSFKATNAALNNLKSGTKTKAREYITEEIDLTKQAVTTSGSTANTRAAQSIKNNPTAAADISAPPSSDVIPATSGSASAGSSSRGFDSGSGPNSGRSANSRPSNRNVASTSNGSPVERAEVIKTITKGSYKETQAQLKSPAFQEKLKNNGIRIYNLKGGDFGARDARTVFLDTGATFVLEE